MFDASPENSERFLYIFSAVNGIYAPLREAIKVYRSLYPKGTSINLKNFHLRTKDFLLVFGGFILLFLISFVILVLLSPSKKPSGASNASKPEITIYTTPITSWPIKRSAKDRWLSEMEAKVSDNAAFYIDVWDEFDKVTVKKQVFPHSIGVRIPPIEQKRYRTKTGFGQLEHVEYIEYSLAFEYDTLQFDFGIDDLSFPKGVAEHPMCLFKIIVDVCDSESFYSSKQNHLFETDWLNDQCCLRRTPEIDVSGHESVRITIKWQFSPRDDGPIAFNLAIVNPILRAEKLRNHAISITKPDSIR